jgi:transposase
MSDRKSEPVMYPTQRRYPPELRERAVRMVLDTIEETGDSQGVVGRVARQLGVGVESLRGWVKQTEIDGGRRRGSTSEDKRRIAALEKENRELRRANDILQAASAFFAAAELDRRLR